MGRQEILKILKEKKKWMSNKDLKEYLDITTVSIGRSTRTLAHDFPDIIEMKIIKPKTHEIFYYRYIGGK